MTKKDTNAPSTSVPESESTTFGFEKFEKADVSEELIEEANGKYRNLTGFPRYLAFGIGVLTTIIIVYTAFAGVFLPMIQRSLIICSMLSLTEKYSSSVYMVRLRSAASMRFEHRLT